MATNEEGIPQHLDSRPELKFLNRHVREQLCAKSAQTWKDLGIELLGVGSNDALNVISNSNTDVMKCCSAMFQLWLDRQPNASWRQLIEALKRLQLNYLADQIESKLIITLLKCDDHASPASSKQQLLTYDNLRAEFGRLIWTICCILEKSPNRNTNLEMCKQLCGFWKASNNTNTLLFSAEKRAEINDSRDFRQFFEIVNQYLSWDEYFILTEIIDVCDSVEAEQELNKYKRKMAISNALEIISSAESNPPKGFEYFCVIIDKPYTKLTVEKYEEIKTFIFSNLDVHRHVTNKYIRVLFDSLHLEWHVTIQAIPHMIKIARKHHAFFARNHFVFMQIGNEVILPDLLPQQQELQLASSTNSVILQKHESLMDAQPLKIILVGNSSVGKSSIIQSFVHGTSRELLPAVSYSCVATYFVVYLNDMQRFIRSIFSQL